MHKETVSIVNGQILVDREGEFILVARDVTERWKSRLEHNAANNNREKRKSRKD